MAKMTAQKSIADGKVFRGTTFGGTKQHTRSSTRKAAHAKQQPTRRADAVTCRCSGSAVLLREPAAPVAWLWYYYYANQPHL
jgi:hypothetical protein